MDKPRILVVEDEPYLRELYTDTLNLEGYTVDSASDGDEALHKIQQGGWDLVLLDIIMPKLDGLEVLKKIRQHPPTPVNKSIVCLTNLDKDEKIKEALKLSDGYLIKSQLTPGDLLTEIKSYLDK